MKKRIISFILLFGFCLGFLSAQDSTATKTNSILPGYITSGLLITTGVIVNKDATKNGVRDWIRERYEVPVTNVDDILQHSPIAMMYIIDLALGSDKNTIGRHTRHMVVTQGLTLGTMLITKGIFNAKRPNGGSHAFPSGHTAYAFASANVIYLSFKDEHPLIAYSGYVPAILVGTYRMIKDKHWISDVLVGAGMGIFFSHLTYHLDIWRSKTDKALTHNSPKLTLGLTNSGFGLAVNF